MSERTILITGSSGLIGRALCHRLGSAGYQIVGFDQDGPPYPPPKTDCIFVDLSNDESVQNGFHIMEERYGSKLHAVIHLAAYYSFEHKESDKYDKITVEGTERMLRELKRFECDQFIFTSTMLVHAPTKPGVKITETSPLEATWGYPRSKIKTESLIADDTGNMQRTVLRVAGVYTDLCQSIPIAHEIKRIYERDLTSHFYSGRLNTRQSYTHLDDLIDCVIQVMDQRDKLDPHSVFLVGEEDAMSYADLQDTIAHLLYRSPWTTFEVPKPLAKVGAFFEDLFFKKESFIKPWMIDRADDNYELDISEIRSTLKWAPSHRLRATLPIMIEGLSTDPYRWYEVNKLHPPSWLKQKQTKETREHVHGAAQH